MLILPFSDMDQDDKSRVDRTQTLQEAKQCFMATSERTDKLADILTRCIYILLQGQQQQQHQLTPEEAKDLFFRVTRLFQYKNKDYTLRKLTHLAVKLLANQATNVYVVTSSLTNDVSSTRQEVTVRASALRALCHISDPSMFASIEGYIRQGLIDGSPVIVSSTIASLVKIAAIQPELVRLKYSNEIYNALNSPSPMVQYHALGLSYCLCNNQPNLISELITNWIHQYHGLQKQTQPSHLAICLLIKIISNYVDNSLTNTDSDKSATKLSVTHNDETKFCFQFVKSLLSHQSKMVEYEAAAALVKLNQNSTESSLFKLAISHLRNFLTSNKQALRFAALRTLNEQSPSGARFWSIHRVSGVCKLHLLNKRYKLGDSIVGILDFTNSQMTCAKYIIMLQCEEVQQYEVKQEFSLGLRQNDFMLTIPMVNTKTPVLHCVLSFLFYIADKNYSKTVFEDKSGTIELGPSELNTKLFSCDFPIAIYT